MLANHKTLAAMHKAVLTYNKYSDQNIETLKTDVIVISSVGIIIMFVLSTLIGSSIVNPLNILVQVSKETSDGDLEEKPYIDEMVNRTEIGCLAKNIQMMRHALSSVIKGLKVSAEKITGLSGRVESLATEVNKSYQSEQQKYQQITDLSEGMVDSFQVVSSVVSSTLESAQASKKEAELSLNPSI
ncbi:HAMP domain-containing protein [Vibrio sonorensis]|uniref:HAMP domain-containing protein n=1 Tax=Vibrio sonorensis TaxID=1004316 RepID=UPI0008D97CC2|nr:methyl-accepting chemotaxis protein [Vibrio sonorensis]